MPARILVVEDEAITAMDLEIILKNMDYEVVSIASRGEEAVKKVGEFKPDLVLMDIVLKGQMDGIEATQRIQSLYDIPIIYLTAFSDRETLKRAKLTKPYGFLTKPVNSDGLMGTIETALYNHDLNKKLARSEENYRSVIDTLQDGFFRLDLEGKIIMASPSLANMYGFNSIEDIIGVSAASLYKNLEDRKYLMAELEKNGLLNDYEVEGLKIDGSSFWLSLNAQYRYDNGEIQGIEGFVRDISERKKAEEEKQKLLENLQEFAEELEVTNEELQATTDELLKINQDLKVQEEKTELERKRLETILETNPAAIIIVEANGKLSYINSRAKQLYGVDITDLELSEAVSKVKAKRIDGIEYSPGESPTGRALKGLEVHNEEVIMEQPDGAIVPILASSAPIFNSEGEIIAAVSVFEDITEFKKAEYEKQKLIEELQQFSEELKVTNEELQSTTQELKENEEKFAKAFHSNSAAMTITRISDGMIIDANESFERLFGYSREETVGHSTNELKIWLSSKERDAEVEKLMKNGKLPMHEVTFGTKYGAHKNVIFSVEMISIGSQNFILSTIMDITERKKAEVKIQELLEETQQFAEELEVTNEELQSTTDELLMTNRDLQESEQRLRRFYESGLIGVIYWDMNGQIIDSNDKFLDITGYTREDMELGRIDWVNMTPPEYSHLDEASMDELKAKGVNKKPFEKEYIRKDGSRVPVIIAGAMLDDECFNGVAFVLDITERKTAENDLLESTQRFEILANGTAGLIWVNDIEGNHLFVNNTYLDYFQVTEEEVSGTNWQPLIHPEDKPKYLKKVLNVINEKKPFLEEVRVQRGDGKWRWIETSAMPRFSSNDEYLGHIGISIDINERKIAEEELKESKDTFKNFFSRIPDYAYIISPEGKIIDVNEAVVRKLGYEKEELLDKPLAMIYAPESQLKMKTLFAKWNETGELKNEEMIIITKTGKKRTVLLNAGAIKDKNGNIIHSASLQTDITELKKAEEMKQELIEELQQLAEELRVSNEELESTTQELQVANEELRETGEELGNINKSLKERDEQLQLFINNAPAAIAMLDTQMNYISTSLRWIEDYGLNGQELQGKSHYDIFPEITDELKAVHKRCLKGAIEYSEEDRFVRADGSIQWVKWEVRPWYLSSDDIGGIIIFSEDITKYKEFKDALMESERKFREVFNNANDMISLNVMNEDMLPGNFIEINDIGVQRLGYSKEELLNMSPRDIVAPENRNEMKENAFELYNEGHNTFEIIHLTKDGKRISVEVNNHLIKYNGQKICLAISRDITERKKSEDKIKESLREKEVLLREIHHRVKNNLQIISSLLNLQKDIVVEEESIDVLLESRNRIQTMAMIHEELYRSSSLKDIKFKEFINSMISNLIYSYGVNSGNIEVITDIEDLYIGLDTAIPCGLIINELVTNSLKYAFPEDHIQRLTKDISGNKWLIELKLKKINDKYHLIISDNGIGIPENVEIENTETLGLKIVNILVMQLDGSIELERNDGTEFKITFEELKYKERF